MSNLNPFSATLAVREARDLYLKENGFTVASYDDKWTEANVLGIKFRVPNTKHHRWGLMLHDLHHVATGFGTNLTGEGEVSAWELSRGFGSLGLYVGSIVVSGVGVGMLAAPRRTYRAYREGNGSLFLDPTLDYDQLLDMTVGELRAQLMLPPEGLINAKRGLHSGAPRNQALKPGIGRLI
jgi:hypothetical protein